MGEAADQLTDDGLELLHLHQRGECGLVGTCPYCTGESRMAKKPSDAPKPERVIALIAGESGSGKSYFIGQLRNALIFDTDIGGGLAYLDARIARNGSERIEVSSYPDVMEEISKRRNQLRGITTLAIDHLTTLQQEAVSRYNPKMLENTFGKEHDKASKEWRKVRELARMGDFHLFCTAHLKGKYENKELVGLTCDAAKNVEADMQQVLYLTKGKYPATARVQKWRRDPEDARGAVPASFPFTLEDFVRIHGFPLEGTREEVPMAGAEQITEIKQLLEVVKVDDETVQKWFTKAKADDWDGFTRSALAACIGWVRAKLPQEKAP
jgi:hypothetical protein